MTDNVSVASRTKESSAATLLEPLKKRQKTAHTAINISPRQELDIYVFGAGEFGELGLGAKPVDDRKPMNVRVPRRNHFLHNVVQIAVGGMHCVALTSKGQILTWGVNDHGALGRETIWDAPVRDVDEASQSEGSEDDVDLNPRESTPNEVGAGLENGKHTFVQVAATNSASFSLTTTGLVFGWGTFSGNDGPVGLLPEKAKLAASTRNDSIKLQRTPVLIPYLRNITDLAAGSNHMLALSQQGRV